jgi:hypothetical protein
MAKAVETYRGTDIYLTADRTLVTPPADFKFCIDGPERDEGPTLTTFATLEEAREYIDDAEGTTP